MEIKKTQPSASRFVESRTAKGASGGAVNAAIRGLQREAQSVGAFVEAAGGLAKSVLRGGLALSAASEREAIRAEERAEDDRQIERRATAEDLAIGRQAIIDSRLEEKRKRDANLSVDLKLYGLQANSAVDELLSSKFGGINFLESDDAKFQASVNRVLSETRAEVEADLNKRGTIRDRNEESGEKAKLALGIILEGAATNLYEQRRKSMRNDALGRANVVAENLSAAGVEDEAQYASAYEGLSAYGFSKDQLNAFKEIALKKGVSAAFGNALSLSFGQASNAFKTLLFENVQSGMSTSAAAKAAYEASKKILESPFLDENGDFRGDYKKKAERFGLASDFNKAIMNANAKLFRVFDSEKGATNVQIANDVKAFMGGTSDSLAYPESYRLLRYYGFRGTVHSEDAETSAQLANVFTGGEADLPKKARGMSAQDASDFTTYLLNDMALLDMSKERDRAQAEKILKYSLLLPETDRASILDAFRNSVLEIGEHKQRAEKARIEKAVSYADDRFDLSKDEKNQLAGYLLEVSKLHGGANIEAYIQPAIEEWRKRTVAQKASGGMIAMLLGESEDNRNTGIDRLKFMLNH